ncbi:hypothetical protein FRC14_007298 [Serendipita sp. 396]|nr:hypothetical protein FRC14_007298 [Serendipita sp. 396]KAG8863247.1 hypothetical protein FRC20_010816 [Serendipita sp. 405]
MEETPVMIEQIKHAAETIRDFVHKTPVLTSATLDGFASQAVDRDVKLLFKCENFQKVGAFKIRGATYAIKRLLETIPNPSALTVVTHSSGNHAQALALAARQLNVKCHVVMPRNAPAVKKNAVQGYGAAVTECTPTLEAREATVKEVMNRLQEEATHRGEEALVRFVPPYDHLDVIRGQGTIAFELVEQADEMGTPLDIVITPVGGGGMLSGVSVAAKGLRSNVLVFGAEPTGASDAQASFRSRVFHPSVQPKTIADGLLTSLGDITFPLILENVDDIFTVTDEEIAKAMKFIWERMKIIVEPSSCVTLAVVLFSSEFKERIAKLQSTNQSLKIGLVLSGGNVDLGSCLALLSNI